MWQFGRVIILNTKKVLTKYNFSFGVVPGQCKKLGSIWKAFFEKQNKQKTMQQRCK